MMASALLSGHTQLPPTGASTPQLAEQIDALVQTEMLAKGIPSVSVAVMRDGKMLVQRAWGVTDVDKKTKADTSTTYQIASSTKQFTAALVLQQVDRGRLSLGDSITEHLSGLKPEFEPIRIEQLVNHTYGLGTYVRPAPWGGITITHGGQTTNGHVSELQWYPKESVAYSLLYNAAPRAPGVSDLIPRIVLGVPLNEKSK